MKSYEEVAKSVFEKSDKYFEEKALKAKRIKTAATAMSCFCLAAVLTVGAVAAMNSSITEYPVGGGSEGQLTAENIGNTPDGDDENDGITPDVTTTVTYPEETTSDTIDTEPLYTTPESITDDNGLPAFNEADTSADVLEISGLEFPDGSFFDISSDPKLLKNTLRDVTPADIDQILAAAQAVSSEIDHSVFVLAETGSEVYSLVEGEVVMAEYDFGLGYAIEVKMTNGKSVMHFHLSEMLAEVGDTVVQGQVIGLAGTTGFTWYSGVGYNITD